jgi:hypothetical protein
MARFHHRDEGARRSGLTWACRMLDDAMATKRPKPQAPRGHKLQPAGQALTRPEEAVLRKLAAAPRKPARRLAR